jgi:hypothetical protein
MTSKVRERDVERWQYPAAVAVATLDNGISVVTIRGIVTPDTAASILADNADWLARSGAMAQIANYEGAAMAIDAPALLAHAAGIAELNPALVVPTALLVDGDQLEMWHLYCSLMAYRAMARAPFVRFGSALKWAADQGAIRAAQQPRGGSGPAAPDKADPLAGPLELHQSLAPAPLKRD